MEFGRRVMGGGGHSGWLYDTSGQAKCNTTHRVERDK